MPPPVLSLTDICIETISKNSVNLHSLEGLDEYLVVRLFKASKVQPIQRLQLSFMFNLGFCVLLRAAHSRPRQVDAASVGHLSLHETSNTPGAHSGASDPGYTSADSCGHAQRVVGSAQALLELRAEVSTLSVFGICCRVPAARFQCVQVVYSSTGSYGRAWRLRS